MLLKKIFIACLMMGTMLWAQGDLRIYSIDNDPKSDLPQKIAKALEANGFTIVANTDMSKPFMIQFKQSDYDVFYLLTAYHNVLTAKLVVKYPDAGIFAPMGFGIYQRKGDKQLHVSVLTAEAQAKIIGLNAVDPLLTEIDKASEKALGSAMPKATVAVENDNPLPAKGPLVSTYKMEVDEEDFDDAKDELAMGIESGLSPKGFVLSNTLDFDMVISDDASIKDPFDFYDTYSICKLKVIYNVAKTRPQAAAFAPCTMMMYKKKGDPHIVIGFPGVYNWMSSARVEDPAAKAELMRAQHDFESMLSDLTE
jgi:uncharacterized protein (DUF302 family)